MEFLMEQKIKSILARVTSETLERLAFLFTFADDERDIDGPEPRVAGRVDFSGFFAGSLLMRVSSSGIQELAVNMLGLDDDDEISAEDKQDAFKEMLNVICGNALPAIAGNQVEFKINPPEILSETAAATVLNEVNPECIVRLMLEEGFCDVYFFIEGRLPEFILGNESEGIQ
jgi:chemotaxis protein CheY-P-specific phosphatase CheC